jgi:hypothetical protein
MPIPDPGPEQCHPQVGDHRPSEGCLPRDILEKAAAALGLSPPADTAALRKQLEERLGVSPGKEASFLAALPLSHAEKLRAKKGYLRPPAPKEWIRKPDTWLDSINILDVMNQYEEAYPNFEFIGPLPIDFAAKNPYKQNKTECLNNEICEFRVKDAIQKGTEYVGIIYNLDRHYQGGSHWVANFIDLKKKSCIYFDSYGQPAHKDIAKFMKWLTTQEYSVKELTYNAKQLQTKNTECGMYSLYFIIRMLAGDDLKTFVRRNINDDNMLKMRKWIFST